MRSHVLHQMIRSVNVADKAVGIHLNLGGRLLDDDPSWDLSVAFDMLPRIPIRLRFIDKDDEFPAQCSILFRGSAESYIDMESLAIGGTYLTGILTKE